MRKWILLFLFCSCWCLLQLEGQYRVPDMGLAFEDEEVPRVDITLAQTDLELILRGDLESNIEYPARFIYTTSYAIDTMEQVGFRLRGNTSRNANKKSFKVSFNAFERGKKWEGLEKMNLNGEHNDPSIMRSKMAWDMYREMGIPSSRCNHVALYINEEFRGLYVNVEHIDEVFVEQRMRHSDGNLYKCLWPADLNYKGPDPDAYKEEFWGRQAYELKTNEISNDYSDLAHLIDVLNNYEGIDQLCELEHILDVDGVLRCMVMDVLIGNWDGAFLGKNNFYLFADPQSGRFSFIPYDLDNTFGIDWFGVQWESTPFYNWSSISGETRPLFETIMSIPEFKSRFTNYLIYATTEIFSPDTVSEYLDDRLELVSELRESDAFAEKDYNYSFEDFIFSFDGGVGGHAMVGLNEYVRKRHEKVLNDIVAVPGIPIVRELAYERAQDTLKFTLALAEYDNNSEVQFHYQEDGSIERQLVMEVEDDIASLSVEVQPDSQEFLYYVSIEYSAGLKRNFPFCKDGLVQLSSEVEYDLVINEFLASNDSAQQDEAGDYDDWIELYNTGGQRINLSDYYLSDDPARPSKWRLPQKFLYPAEYYVVWADNEGEQGDDHANFKLSKSGEFLGLFAGPVGGYFPADTFTYYEQLSDKSLARLPNGRGDFVATEEITFAYNNENFSSTINAENSVLNIYPNPVSGELYVFSSNTIDRLEVYDILGNRWLDEDWSGSFIDVSGLAVGTYVLRVIEDAESRTIRFIRN